MQLLRCQLTRTGPFDNVVLSFASDAAPRPLTCLFGSAGTGKTTVLAALAATRPGHAVVQMRPGAATRDDGAHVISDWATGDDDPARPHPLRVVTPNASLAGESEEQSVLRRREQLAFDRRAAERGFVFVAIPALRWFGRSPLVLSGHERSLGRYDVRAPLSFDDATRNDFARETKQILSGAALATALAAMQGTVPAPPVVLLDGALRHAVNELVSLAGYRYVGAHPETLEPTFEEPSGRRWSFDDAPTSVRHLACFAALPVRALYAAYGPGDPLHREAVVAIDDIELHHDSATHRGLGAALKRALPRAQWVVTTSSALVAAGCDTDELMALRRSADDPRAEARIEVHTGTLAVVH